MMMPYAISIRWTWYSWLKRAEPTSLPARLESCLLLTCRLKRASKRIMGDRDSVLHKALALNAWRIESIRSFGVVHIRLGVWVYWYRAQG
jgi:hypothetical protein